jgi:hypothetical protein
VRSRSRAVEAVCDVAPPPARLFSSPHGAATPRTQLLSNGRYTVMITAAGSGYSWWRDLTITRWREGATSDDSGSYIFVRDVASGERWSARLAQQSAITRIIMLVIGPLYMSRGDADYVDRLLSAMRKQCGGHDEKTTEGG